MSSIENALNSVEIPVEGVVYVAARPTLGTPRIARVGNRLGGLAQAAEGVGAIGALATAAVGVGQAAEANNLAAEANAQNAAALAAVGGAPAA
ncbi:MULTISPECIES: hypothetical protein [Streptomyces]|uniref:Uncharacterized protein n=1 Tax=Streptomyces stelliscabiei TaxID=146820 RepID=A0A8I0NYN1_9ACTN|nr:MULTISPECIES: hypothetical protein [Streptomyces]MBE1594940.1 hypothetical protein [Streptomyces stelliscabiei]MDX2520715.1 hypothetical protein [Streptomyces stelliscabiei]MDX2551069.1 hypothetical protein [Streptomyces stelliscabiei]MDX2614856.1 hypothetical protein [Streptomyces stelliscabiei]MDX2635544.1 hypothetical protein [Streptomyces stelliscabiei]